MEKLYDKCNLLISSITSKLRNYHCRLSTKWRETNPTYLALVSYGLLLFLPFVCYSIIGVSAFNFPDDEKYRSVWDLLYFSVVTATTLGYGEIQPVSPTARLIAGIQSICGPVLLAVFVSRMFYNTALKRDYQIRTSELKLAYSRVQQLNSATYSNLSDLYALIVQEADSQEPKQIRFHDLDDSFYSINTGFHSYLHRSQESRLFVLTLHGSNGDFLNSKNLEYIKRMNAEWAHFKIKLERHYIVNLSFEHVNNGLRDSINTIIDSIDNINATILKIQSSIHDSSLLNYHTRNYFNLLWYTLQEINFGLSYLEQMPGVSIDAPCDYSKFDTSKAFNIWRSHKISRGIRIISTFDDELRKS